MSQTTINGVQVPFLPVGGVGGLNDRPPVSGAPAESFEEVLRSELDGLRFSKHAQQRLESRSIQLSPTDLTSIQSAVSKAEQKGARESLILLRDLAFVVSIPNRTVVTAMDGEKLHDNVFTNIDSAVVAH